MEQFKIERLNESNFPLLHKLYNEVFPSTISYENLYKKYTSPIFGIEGHFLGFLALNHAGEAVSYTGNVPFNVQIDGIVYKASQNGDTMTRPDARKNHLISKLLNRCNDLCATLGHDFVYGFPNQNINGIYVKHCGWTILEHAQVIQFTTNALPISSLANKFSGLNNLYNSYLSKKLGSIKVERFINKKNWNGVLRDKSFYRYKTYTTNFFLTFKHGKIWCKIKGALFIGDIELYDENRFLDFITELKSFAKSCGIGKVIFIASRDIPIMHRFTEHFKVTQAHGIGYKILRGNAEIEIEKLRFTYGDYDTF